MNDEQQDRLNKVLKTTGYVISVVVVWFYGTKWLLSLFDVLEESKFGLFISLGILWPIVSMVLLANCYALYGWIRTGKKGDLYEALFGGEKGAK